MRGNGPFKAYHEFVTYPKILALQIRMNDEKHILNKLKHLRVQSVNNAPDWENCVHVQFEPENYNRNLILNMIASKLVHEHKNPVEIAKSINCIWVKTE